MRFGNSQNDWKTELMVFRNLKTILFLKQTKDENECFIRFLIKTENYINFKQFAKKDFTAMYSNPLYVVVRNSS